MFYDRDAAVLKFPSIVIYFLHEVSSVAPHLIVKFTLSLVNKRLANYHTTIIHWDFYAHFLFSNILLEVEREVDLHQLPINCFP